ncbi:MAG TPA: hypothetical protein VLD83_13215 [Candidatus Binatia bacterium]|nr:hypothetical protein [Candidatus Binatia bacterium]
MRLSIRQATARDLDEVAGILREAARWLEERRMAMWRQDDSASFTVSRLEDALPAGRSLRP